MTACLVEYDSMLDRETSANFIEPGESDKGFVEESDSSSPDKEPIKKILNFNTTTIESQSFGCNDDGTLTHFSNL